MDHSKAAALMGATVMLAGLAVPAVAADTGWFGGLSVGRTRNSFDTSDFSSGLPGVSESQDSGKTGGKFFGGYNFNKYFGLEGAYTDLGTFSYNYSGASSANANFKANAWSLAGVGTVPLGMGFSLFGKLGLARTHATESLNDPGNLLAASTTPALHFNGSDNRTSALWGGGLEYAINPVYSLRAEYEDYGRVGDSSTTGSARDNMWSLGLKVNF